MGVSYLRKSNLQIGKDRPSAKLNPVKFSRYTEIGTFFLVLLLEIDVLAV